MNFFSAPKPASPAQAFPELTSREVEVLELVARGASNADIAAALFISEATVKTHLLHTFAKLGVDDRTAAVVAALERGEAALDVRDDGAGFAPEGFGHGPDGGLGLRGMRERVEALGGRLAVESAPGRGTTIAVTVPVR